MRHLFGPFGLIGKLGFLGIRHVIVVGVSDTWTGEQPPPPRLVPSLPVLHLLLVPADCFICHRGLFESLGRGQYLSQHRGIPDIPPSLDIPPLFCLFGLN